MSTRVLYVVVCAAPPARAIGEFVVLLNDQNLGVCVIPTPSAVAWINPAALAEQTGYPVRHQHRQPDDPDTLPPAHAIAVVPATFNTINKWAGGISDTFALGILNEALGLNVPIIVAPYAKPALAAHPAFGTSVNTLTACGATVLPNEAIRGANTEPTSSPSYDWMPVLSAIRSI